jgi:hypothetical protein
MTEIGTAGVATGLLRPVFVACTPCGRRAGMPDREYRQMIQELFEAALEWYKLNVKSCPICSESWPMPTDTVAMLSETSEGVDLKHGVKVIPIICKCCGYAMLVSTTSLKPKTPTNPPHE